MPTRGKARKIGVRVESRPVWSPRQKGELRRQRQQQRQVHAHPVGHVDGLVGVVDAHVHVDAEDELLAGHELEAGDQVPVARPRHDPLVLPHRERVGARRPDGQAALGGQRLDQRGGAPAAAIAGLARVRQGVVAISQTDSISSGLTSPSRRPLPQIREQALDRVGQIERLRVDDHELLLDADACSAGPVKRCSTRAS